MASKLSLCIYSFQHNWHGQQVDSYYVYSFYHMFRERFCTTQQKATWQKQLFAIQQDTNTVDIYINRFKQLKEQVDTTNNFSATFLTQLFIQGLRPEYSVNVQASEPADLTVAITVAWW